MQYVLLSDMFIENYPGGAEASDEALLQSLVSNKISVEKVLCRKFDSIKDKKDKKYIISNFATLSQDSINFIYDNCSYVIYEHDYKFLSLRDPAKYNNSAPTRNDVVHYAFFKKAKRVFLQTQKHADIYRTTTGLLNYEIVGGSLWSNDQLDVLEKFSSCQKNDLSAVVGYVAFNKGRQDAVEYCLRNNVKYEMVPSDMSFSDFVQKLSEYKKLIFMPRCYESCSRITLEARMLNMSVALNKNVPVQFEPYFKDKKGIELINLMREILVKIPHKIIEALN